MLRISFDGLSGHFEFLNATQVLEIINVIGERGSEGWVMDNRCCFLQNIGKLNSFPNDGLESIIWPGGILDIPVRRMPQEFDAAIGDITITANRSLYVDFTLPYTDLGLATLSRNADATSSLWIFMKPLSSDLWIMNDEFQGPMVQQIGATMWFAFSTLSMLIELADALSKGSKKGGVDAVIEEIPYIKEFLAQYPFGYSVVVSEDVTNGFGFSAIFLFTLYYIHEKVHYTYAKLTGGRLASILRFLLPQSTIGVE
ncbi:putative solute-binding protein family 3/ domain of MltF [Helianthus annuus]|nr:putative solute-binding protein family 3/ domain of MltF [Helianthus annuus]